MEIKKSQFICGFLRQRFVFLCYNNLMNNIQIKFINTQKTITCPYGTIASTLIEHFDIPREKIAAIKENNEIRPLGTTLLVNASVEPVLVDSQEGVAVYRRTLSFVLAIAAQKIFPKDGVYVGHSI
jgi:uridine kinase